MMLHYEGLIGGCKKIKEKIKLLMITPMNKELKRAGIIFGFDGDRKDVFQSTLKACEELGIDGATASLLTPLPGTPLYEQFKEEGRLFSPNWADYNGKTRVTYLPRHMSPRELYEGYMWFRKNFYSWRSIFKRLRTSKVNLPYSFMVNVGYKIALEVPAK